MDLSISKIRTDGGTQPRAVLDESIVDEYAEALDGGATFPPVIVFHDGKEYWLADGFHRLGAYRKVEKGKIPAEVRQGTQADAQWHSYSVNQTHGVRRTNADKQRAVQAALAHPNGLNLSNGVIAEHVGVSDMMVAKYKPEPTPKDLESPRTGRDGRTINTAHIGKGKRIMSKEEYEALPDDEVAQAVAAGVTGQPVPQRRGMGVQLAHDAIAVLKRIPLTDALRGDGLDLVVRWIEHNRN